MARFGFLRYQAIDSAMIHRPDVRSVEGAHGKFDPVLSTHFAHQLANMRLDGSLLDAQFLSSSRDSSAPAAAACNTCSSRAVRCGRGLVTLASSPESRRSMSFDSSLRGAQIDPEMTTSRASRPGADQRQYQDRRGLRQ